MNLHRIDLVSLSLFNLVARTGSISQGVDWPCWLSGPPASAFPISKPPSAWFCWSGVKLTSAGQALQRHTID